MFSARPLDCKNSINKYHLWTRFTWKTVFEIIIVLFSLAQLLLPNFKQIQENPTDYHVSFAQLCTHSI